MILNLIYYVSTSACKGPRGTFSFKRKAIIKTLLNKIVIIGVKGPSYKPLKQVKGSHPH